jgi:hypothetical protein
MPGLDSRHLLTDDALLTAMSDAADRLEITTFEDFEWYLFQRYTTVFGASQSYREAANNMPHDLRQRYSKVRRRAGLPDPFV